MDYYNILGVTKNASDKDLKQAYKKLSMQHHPDRGGDESKFKEINEAYSTLKDPHKKAMYDHRQTAGQGGFNFNNNASGHPFEDLFGSMFGAGFAQQRRPQQPTRNRDIQLRYTMQLTECFTGVNTTIQYKLPNGRSETVDINIPPGCKDGDMVKVSGYGDESIPQLPRGDLVLRVSIQKVKDWKIEGTDLHFHTELSIFDLLTGTDITILSPSTQRITLNIPLGTQPGTTFRVPGYGLPDYKTGRTGILYVHIKGRVPKITDPATVMLLADIKNKLNG